MKPGLRLALSQAEKRRPLPEPLLLPLPQWPPVVDLSALRRAIAEQNERVRQAFAMRLDREMMGSAPTLTS